MKTLYFLFLAWWIPSPLNHPAAIPFVQRLPIPPARNAVAKTLLAIFAHPDDEVAVSPLLARYARQGVQVYLAIATDGQKGVMPHARIPAGDSLAKVRREEARCACQRLHIAAPILLGLGDGSLSSRDTLRLLHQQIARLFTELKPEVVITWGPEGGYGHADHRMVSNVVTEVFQEGGENWPRQLFYSGFPKEALQHLPAMKTFAGKWLSQSLHTAREQYLPYRIAYQAEDFSTARVSYACHQSQFTPEAMDEIFQILEQTKGKIYLRPYQDNTKTKTDIFEPVK